MSIINPISVDLPLPILPHALFEPERDATTKAVLRYLQAERKAASDRREHADAFDHLVALCYGWTLAKRNKKTGVVEGRYFLRDRFGSLKIERTPQFSNKDGGRTGYNVREEGLADDVTRAWIQGWLLTFLAPYRAKSPEQVIAAADAGKFRYLGLWCRMALKNLVYRQHKREKKERFTGFATATEYLGTNEMDAPSTLRPHLPFEQGMAGVENARNVIKANENELERLDLSTGLLAYLSVAEYVTEPHFEGRVTRAIAEMKGVSESAARAYKRQYHETIERQIAARNPALQAVINELTQQPMSFVAPESAENEDNRRLLRESRQLMAGYANDCRDQGLSKSANDAGGEEKRLRREEERVLEKEYELTVQ